jgi:formiminotetrahydrofolate cyclodeaminase
MGVVAQAGSLESRCVALAEADAAAFARAVAALERGSDLEKPLTEVVSVLLDLGETAADVASLAATTVERCDGMSRGNAAAAAHLAEAAARVAATLVQVNLSVGLEDERLAHARRFVDAATDAARRAGESSR